MCDTRSGNDHAAGHSDRIPLAEAVGTILAHDITEIRPGEFKGCAFTKGHVVKAEDVCHLQRLGKEHLFVLNIKEDEMHEDDAALALADALMGEGVRMKEGPKEGKINIVADRDGLLRVNREALFAFNMLGEIMCATLHNDTVVKKDRTVAGTRAIPLVVKRKVVEEATRIARGSGRGVIEVREIRRPKAGVVITGNEVYYGRIQDSFAPVIESKIRSSGGEIVGTYYAPDDEQLIEARLRDLINAGADLLITTGGMSVDPDDVTRFAIDRLGAADMTYGSSVLPGAMFLVAYIDRKSANEQISPAADECGSPGPSGPRTCEPSETIPVLGIPACGLYAKTTIFDLVLPRILAGERIGRRELAELGHGGLCMKCEICGYPVCPFGK